jgi:hypothetical protein
VTDSDPVPSASRKPAKKSIFTFIDGMELKDFKLVIPANAGIQEFCNRWIPAFAGMTPLRL